MYFISTCKLHLSTAVSIKGRKQSAKKEKREVREDKNPGTMIKGRKYEHVSKRDAMVVSPADATGYSVAPRGVARQTIGLNLFCLNFTSPMFPSQQFSHWEL